MPLWTARTYDASGALIDEVPDYLSLWYAVKDAKEALADGAHRAEVIYRGVVQWEQTSEVAS